VIWTLGLQGIPLMLQNIPCDWRCVNMWPISQHISA